MSDVQSEIGRVIADRYKLTSLLGQGGMGSVWRAEHLMLGSEVAIKLIDPAVVSNEEVRARFVREAKAAAQLRSPHVVQILDYGVDGDTPFIAMELMVGESLADRLDRVGRVSAQETSRIITEVSRALGKAHEAGIIHRDLKPDNIFLVHNDDTEIAKVLDFGVAKKQNFGADDAHMTSTGAVLGTPYYMSPEQAEGLKGLDHRTDIWALAVIAYECMLGVRPFDGDTLGGVFLSICARDKPVPSLVMPDLPEGFDGWFEKGTSRIVDHRYATARELAAGLREVVEGPGAGRATMDSVAVVDATMLGASGTVNMAGTPAVAAAGDTGGVPGAQSEGAAAETSGVATQTGGVPAETQPGGSGAAALGAAGAVGAVTSGAADTVTGQHDDLALSTAGTSANELPLRKSKAAPLLLVASLVVVSAAVGLAFLLSSGGGEEELAEEDEEALVVDESAATEAFEEDVEVPEPEEAIEPEPQVEPEAEPKKKAEPPPAPAPVAQPAPRPRPQPVTRPKPKPKPKPKAPAPAPTSDEVNLGL